MDSILYVLNKVIISVHQLITITILIQLLLSVIGSYQSMVNPKSKRRLGRKNVGGCNKSDKFQESK